MFHKGRTNAYSPHTDFSTGDRVEFYSGGGGGTWKPGVVVESINFYVTLNEHQRRNGFCNLVRIRVGEDDVCVIRPASKCRRLAGTEPTTPRSK